MQRFAGVRGLPALVQEEENPLTFVLQGSGIQRREFNLR